MTERRRGIVGLGLAVVLGVVLAWLSVALALTTDAQVLGLGCVVMVPFVMLTVPWIVTGQSVRTLWRERAAASDKEGRP